MGTAATHFAGIDVSKATLDCCLLAPDGATRERAFPNDPGGHAALLAWADRHAAGAGLHFAMEASGGYEDALACHLHAAGRHVSVVNPTRIKYAGVMRGRRNKTDKADARLIAAYTRDEAPPAWSPPPPSGSCRRWSAAGTTSASWPPTRRPGSTRPCSPRPLASPSPGW